MTQQEIWVTFAAAALSGELAKGHRAGTEMADDVANMADWMMDAVQSRFDDCGVPVEAGKK